MLIILDRDGVINEDSPDYIKSPNEWIPIPGSLEAIAKLKAAGFIVAIATNQSGIARGYYDHQTLDKIHEKMALALKQFGAVLDGIFYCPHLPDDKCFCRKPSPGLLQQIGEHFKIDLTKSICIGDSMRDLLAAKNAGAKPMLVLTGNGVVTRRELTSDSIPVFDDLQTAVNHLCECQS